MGYNHFRADKPRWVEFYLREKLHRDEDFAQLKWSEIDERFSVIEAGETLPSVIIIDGGVVLRSQVTPLWNAAI